MPNDRHYGSFEHIPDHFPPTRFRNVTKFAIELYMVDDRYWNDELRLMLSSIQFERLDSFDVITYNQHSIDFLIEWMVGNTELTQASFTELNAEQLRSLVGPLRKLKLLTLEWRYQPIEVLNEFLSDGVAKNSSLKQINIHICDNSIFTRRNFTENIAPGWYSDERNAAENSVQLYRLV